MALFDRIRDRVTSLIDSVQPPADAEPLTFAEAIRKALDLIVDLVRLVDSEPEDGAEKKAAVLAAVSEFHRRVVAPLDIPYVPEWIESQWVDPAIDAVMQRAASAVIDWIVSLIRSGELA